MLPQRNPLDEDNNPHRGCHKALAFNTLLSSQETDTHPRTPTPPGRHPAGATLLLYPFVPVCPTRSDRAHHDHEDAEDRFLRILVDSPGAGRLSASRSPVGHVEH
ncbi:hypothetical protein HNR21_004035 [Actinomadura cellulosilytica]|uniref:Uncharacterized protein n=1 Tax=Thermomonospora cellulosilytica TaxID=1411118 RepID=A0A7W3N0A0_9ACTN|nr:hypothetical protein [Thermomonospora cellulosilytica]